MTPRIIDRDPAFGVGPELGARDLSGWCSLDASDTSGPRELATGGAGDVFLCHPFLVHGAGWPHPRSTPRFIAQPPISLPDSLQLDGPEDQGLIRGPGDTKRDRRMSLFAGVPGSVQRWPAP
jgi:hypothetical protein